MCYNVQLADVVIESGNNNTGLNQYSYNENENNTDCNETFDCSYLIISKTSYWIYSGYPFYVSASIYDCSNVSYEWKNDLQACIISGPVSFDSNVYQQCTTITYEHYNDNYYYHHSLLS